MTLDEKTEIPDKFHSDMSATAVRLTFHQYFKIQVSVHILLHILTILYYYIMQFVSSTFHGQIPTSH